MAETGKAAGRILTALPLETAYSLSTLDPEEQEQILRQCLDEEELKILEQYLDENGTMDACGFREYASVFSDLYSDKTTVYTGNPESAGKDGRVETVYDEGICEGVRVVRGNRMFDYSI